MSQYAKKRLPVIRPRTRGECADVPRPCPWASCRYNLGIDVLETGRIKVNHGNESCSLDVADRGVQTLGVVAGAIGLTRERIRQIEREFLSSRTRRLVRKRRGL